MLLCLGNDAEIDKYFNDELRKTENNCAAVASIMTMIKFFNNKGKLMYPQFMLIDTRLP